MRVLAILAAVTTLTTMLGGCEAATTPLGATQGSGARAPAAPPDATTDAAFDYRYAFRLPPARIAAVQESHARGCEQLGPARCRIVAMRYSVGDDNAIAATLTLRLDPLLARAYGKAAERTVVDARGTMTDAVVAGADAAAHGDSVLARLRDALGNAEAAARTAAPAEQAPLAARAERLRAAIATIGEVDQGAASGVATAPVLLRYSSSGAIPGIGASPQATFESAGDTFLGSLAGLLVVLAGVGPWIVLLLGGALALRWTLARTEQAPAAPAPAPQQDDPHRNVIQRWFNRDDAKEHEPAD